MDQSQVDADARRRLHSFFVNVGRKHARNGTPCAPPNLAGFKDGRGAYLWGYNSAKKDKK
jgi:hypothetical protein